MALSCLLVLALAATARIAAAASSRPNFLFIAVDDLNDFTGYAAEEPGDFLQAIYPDAAVRAQVKQRLTPNLDRLAAQSSPFLRAYCASALCGPSRTSLLTGVSPHRSGYYLHHRHFRLYDTLRDAVTLPQQLKAHGYFTAGLGKIFHAGHGTVDGPVAQDWADARHSWSQWINHPIGCKGGQPGNYSPPNGGLMQFGPSRLRLKQAGDWLAADFTARLLEHGKATTTVSGRRASATPQTVTLPEDRPFFLGCGLFRPHLPFYAPKAFFDKFPIAEMTGLNRARLEAIIADLEDLPPGARRFSDYGNGKMKVVMEHARKIGGREAEIPAWRAMVQAYLACVSFADACIGRILEGLERSPWRDQTVVVLWSDHGYHLGAKYHVAKQALWEEANRVTLLIRDPRNPSACHGQPRRQIVGLNDLYPTICELAGVPLPVTFQTGRSLVPLLNDAQGSEPHDAVLMTYQAGNHSLRTSTHRFMRYRDGSLELYDMIGDPGQVTNLAAEENAAPLVKRFVGELNRRVAGEILNPPEAGPTGRRDKPRLIILADMGNEPDEEQQMVHMLVDCNMFDLEGLIAVTGKFLREDHPRPEKRHVRPDLFRKLIDGYAQVVDHLRLHASGWPAPEYLRSIVRPGQRKYGLADVGPGKSSEGSRLIVTALEKDDPRPLNVVINAGANTLAQALVDFRAAHTPAELQRAVAQLRVYENGAQDNTGAWICHEFPAIHWIRSNHQTYGYMGEGKGVGPYVWQPYPRSNQGQHRWAEEHIMRNHGALGALYPYRFRGNGFLEGGGTVPWLGLVNRGLYDPDHPGWGGWSGRFTATKQKNVWSRHADIRKDETAYGDFYAYADASDHWTDPEEGTTYTNIFAPIWRWRRAIAHDCIARFDWCVKPRAQANHHPVAAVDGDRQDTILRRQARANATLSFDASASDDPDGDALAFRWWIYPEAGTYRGGVKLENANRAQVRMRVPADAGGREIHLILEVQDHNPTVSLYDYRRIVIEVTP